MTLRVTHSFDCDGCGQEIEPGAVLPVTLLDENRREVHFHDHRCLVPYAERRHAERLAAVRTHLAGNVEQIKANLGEAEAHAASDGLPPSERQDWQRQADTIRPFLPEAEAALAAHDAKHGEG